MSIPLQYVYLMATVPLSIVWILIFVYRRDLRKEILTMSILVAFGSFVTSYFWWTDDWWRPLTITGTRAGVEDIISGFTTGGIMASLYEVVFRKTLYHKIKTFNHIGALALITFFVFTELFLKSFGMTTFYASSLSIVIVAGAILVMRRDLISNAIFSGIFMLLISFIPYLLILSISPEWIDATYLSTLSGYRFIGIPAEELIFWFLAGFWFGPFYEYWKGGRLRAKSFRITTHKNSLSA